MPQREGDAESSKDGERKLVEVEVADWFAGWSVFGFLHRFLEFLGEDVFLVGLLEPGVAEFVFALAIFYWAVNVALTKEAAQAAVEKDAPQIDYASRA